MTASRDDDAFGKRVVPEQESGDERGRRLPYGEESLPGRK